MYKSEQNRLRRELKQLLEGKPEGIPLSRLHVSYNKKFHKNLLLKECGIKMADVSTVYKDMLEEVVIGGQKCLRLKGIAKGAEGGSSGNKTQTGAKSKKAAAAKGVQGEPFVRQQQGNEQRESKKKAAPAALTVPQYAFEPVKKKKPAEKEQPAQKQKAIDRKPAMAEMKPDTNQQAYGNPLEYQMQQYISGVYNSQAPYGVGSPVASLADPTYRSHYQGGGVGAGDFSFDQGSLLGQYNPHQKKQDMPVSGAGAVAGAGTGRSEDSQNWPSLAEAKSTKPKTSVKKQVPPVEKQNTKKAVPLMSLSTSSTRSASPARTSNRSSRDITYYRRNAFPREQLDDYAQNCIINLAENKELVTIPRVMTLVKQRFQAESIGDLGLRGEFELESIKQLQRLQTKINASIQAFVKVRAIGTLHELQDSLAKLEGKTEFAEHNLGPLTKQPLVYDLFKFPTTKSDSEIPRITTMDILEVLRQYLSKKELWKARVKLEDFMQYVVEFYGVESPYELGIRIQSVGLGISVLKTAQREQKQITDIAREETKTKIKEECQTAMMKIKRAIMMHVPEITDAKQFTPSTGLYGGKFQRDIEEWSFDRNYLNTCGVKGHLGVMWGWWGHNNAPGAGLELRKSYATMTASAAINTVFENVCELLGRNYKLDTFAYHLNGVKQDAMASALFQLALCLGSLEPPKELVEDEPPENNDKDDDHYQDQQVPEGRGSQPTDAQVLEELKRYLDKLIQGMGVPKLKDLASIEKRLCQTFKAATFSNLLATQRTFLEFMALDHPQVLEAFGGSLLGVGSSNPMMGSPYRPSRMDVMEFIRQCGPNKHSPDAISAALCSHYQITNVEELGQGQLSMVMKPLLMATRSSYDTSHSRPITYEAALCVEKRSCNKKSLQVGLLGTQSLERALGCLNSAPLLEDLAEWTHWELVFEPEHGDLKSFIEKNPGLTMSPPVEIHALETKPGVLLKLAGHTTTDHFSVHAQNGDAINTAGHLVSLVVQDGIANVPMALLGNHMEAALAKMLSKDMDSERSNLKEGHMVTFAKDVLTKMPTQIAQIVAQQVILRPLSSVVGSDAKSRELLLQACRTSTQRSRLQKLGLLLGISKWKTAIEERLPVTADDEDDIYDDDGEADIDVDSLLAAAASTSKVKAEGRSDVKKQEEQISLSSDDVTPKTDSLEESVDQEDQSSKVEDEVFDDDDTTDEKADILDEEEDEGTGEEDIPKDDSRSEGDGAESEECLPNGEDKPAAEKTTENEDDTLLAKIKEDKQEDEKQEQKEAVTGNAEENEENGEDNEGNGEENEDSASKMTDDKSESTGGEKEEETSTDPGSVTDLNGEDISEIAEIEEEDEPEPEPEEPEPELTESQRHVWECKTVIDNVRHDEFGVGMKLNEETRQLMQRHQDRIGRSLQRLSEELYSKDTHFVLELIQNADDNKYNLDKEPSLVFVVDTEAVTAMNNERGFSEQDIRALCDVGKSTKGKHKHGYIGHKGIGFKSVFRVTDSPEIHSNGYHICFEHGKDPMGYILPTWIGPQDLYQLADFPTNADWATTIKLPLKGDMQRTSSLVNKFQDIQPSLLLFLHRLRSIVIVNKDEGITRQMKRQDIGDNVVEIKHNKVTESWLVVKEMLDATKLHRERVESTELALAFPLKAGSNNQNREQSVFAFLPLRSYGFHFIIQGDFDIPSSREDVDSDSAWNQWLQQNIAPLFVQALDTFKDHYEEDPIEAVCNFLQFVPLESQILTEFFKKVAVSIHQRLKATPCLPVVASDDDEVEWKLPAETVMAKDPLIRDVVQSSVLKTHLNCHYLHQQVVEKCSTTLLSNLGVKSLQTSDLIGILKSVAIMANNTCEHLPVETVAKWLACVYRCRERDYDVSEDKLEQLRAIPVIPLTSGERVAVKDVSVFFPITADDKVSPTDQKHFQSGSHVLKAVEADMAMVDAKLLSSLDDVANSQIRRMLEELGVRHISPQEVIQHHILPVFKSDKWQTKIRHNYDILIGYLVYIKEQHERQPSVCNMQTDLKPYVQVITNHGPCNPTKTPVHFPKTYGNAIDLPSELPGCDWVLLDSSYLIHRGPHVTARDLTSWQQFFTQLGVLCYLAIENKEVTYKESEMSSSPWVDVYSFWPKPADGVYKIQDQVCNEFEQLISANFPNPESQKLQRHKLLNLFHQRWQDTYAKFTVAKLLDSVSGNTLKEVPSSFAVLMRTSRWLPSVADGTLQFRSPVDIFLHSQKLYDLLGPHVPYLTLNLPPESQFLQFLNIRNLSCISPDFMLAMLKTWCHYQEDAAMTTTGLGVSFRASLGHIIRVYRYLHENCRQKELKELFDDHPAVFVPQDPSVKDWRKDVENLVQGQFVHKRCTYWHDPTGLLQKLEDKANESELPQRFAVSAFYQDLQGIFLGGKLIDQTPTIKEYVLLLVDLASEITLPDNDKLQDVLKVYGMLGKKCAEHSSKEAGDMVEHSLGETSSVDVNSQSCQFLRGLLQEEAVFPTRANRWVSLANKPILCSDDSAELEKLFEQDPRVNLLNMADKDRLGRTIRDTGGSRGRPGYGGKENIKQFLEACQIQTLTECAERELIPTLLQASPNVQLFLYTICPYIQLFISTHSQRDKDFDVLYQQLQVENIAARLKTMTIFEVDKLEVLHRMKHDVNIFASSTMECGIEKGGFYVVNKVVPHLHRNIQVRREIAKMFTKGFGSCQKTLFNFLGNLLLSLEPSHLGKGISQTLCQQLDLEPLDEDTEVWQVPKPIMPEVIRKPPPPPAAKMEKKKDAEDAGQSKSGEADLEGEAGLIHSWPPKSSAFGPTMVKGAKSKDDEAEGLKMWPPPAPPASANPVHPPPPPPMSPGDLEGTSHSTSSGDFQRQPSVPGDSSHPNLERSESRDSAGEGKVFHRQVSAASDGSTVGQGPKRSGDGQEVHGGDVQAGQRMQHGERQHTLGDYVKSDQHQQVGGESQQQSENLSEGEVLEDSVEAGDDIEEEDEENEKALTEEEEVEEVSLDISSSSLDDSMAFHTPPSVRHTSGPFTGTPGSSKRSQLAPTWTALPTVEVEFEDLARGAEINQYMSVLEISPDMDEAEGNMQTGRWGEALVYNYLCQQSESAGGTINVIWVNESGETGHPYDVVVEGEDFKIYVEVKATKLDQKELFEISSKEVAFAEQQKEQFHLYRVYNAGSSDNVRLCRLQNLSLKMERKEVRLCMYI